MCKNTHFFSNKRNISSKLEILALLVILEILEILALLAIKKGSLKPETPL